MSSNNSGCMQSMWLPLAVCERPQAPFMRIDAVDTSCLKYFIIYITCLWAPVVYHVWIAASSLHNQDTTIVSFTLACVMHNSAGWECEAPPFVALPIRCLFIVHDISGFSVEVSWVWPCVKHVPMGQSWTWHFQHRRSCLVDCVCGSTIEAPVTGKNMILRDIAKYNVEEWAFACRSRGTCSPWWTLLPG
jgi:hypothetical protein